MRVKLPPHVHRVRNKAGQSFYYLSKHRGTTRAEKAVRLPDINDPAFWPEYARLLNLPPPRIRTDTFDALISAWISSPEWAQLSEGTRKLWLPYTARIARRWGPLQVKGLEPQHVLAFRDAWAHVPATANNMIKCLSSMLSWSVPRGWRSDNPCREIKPLRGGDPYDPWPWELIEQARLELRPDLWWALALAVYTGQRLSDVLAMRWSAISSTGLISVRQNKTKKQLLIPIHRELQLVLDIIPKRATTILTNSAGRPWKTGFKSAWRKNRPQVVIDRGLVFHGLRKTAVVTLLEAGCTDAEVAAVTGQSRDMVEHYARKVNQEKLARSAILRWEQNGP